MLIIIRKHSRCISWLQDVRISLDEIIVILLQLKHHSNQAARPATRLSSSSFPINFILYINHWTHIIKS